MLSNAYFLAKFRCDTAENEPAKNLQKFAKIRFPFTARRSRMAAAKSAGVAAPGEVFGFVWKSGCTWKVPFQSGSAARLSSLRMSAPIAATRA